MDFRAGGAEFRAHRAEFRGGRFAFRRVGLTIPAIPRRRKPPYHYYRTRLRDCSRHACTRVTRSAGTSPAAYSCATSINSSSTIGSRSLMWRSRRRASWGFFYWPRRFLFYNHARSERPCPFLSRKAAFFKNGGLCYSYKIKNIKTPSIQSTLCLYHPLRLLGPGELQVVLCVKLAHPGSGRSVAGAATERAIEPPC